MVKTPKSPGDYGTEIYSYINELDPTFKDDVTTDQFLEKIQDEAYANKIYAYLADSDETFVEDISLEDFLGDRRYGICFGRWFIGATTLD
jgi:hypothetical protein